MASRTAEKKGSTAGTGIKQKLDLKKEFKDLYHPSAKKVSLVNVPEMNYLMVNGNGDPNDNPVFQQAIESLYGLAYTLKFMLKKEGAPIDFTVMPLEGLWWMSGGEEFDMKKKDAWKWTLMIALPDFIEKSDIERALEELKKKKDPGSLGKIRMHSWGEGKAVQIMHVGPYAEEERAITKLHDFAVENGLKIKGKHHEIYMGDPRRTAPEKLKTIIRHPVV